MGEVNSVNSRGGRAIAFTFALVSCLSCSLGQGSGTVPDGVHYWERLPGGHVLVDWFPDEDCLVVVRQGADTDNLDGVRANCTDTELAEGYRLLGTEAWKAYESADVPSVPSDLSGGSGTDDGSGAPKAPPAGDIAVGSIEVQNELVGEGQFTKTFWADDLGPEEAELVAYFRALHEKYGDFD